MLCAENNAGSLVPPLRRLSPAGCSIAPASSSGTLHDTCRALRARPGQALCPSCAVSGPLGPRSDGHSGARGRRELRRPGPATAAPAGQRRRRRRGGRSGRWAALAAPAAGRHLQHSGRRCQPGDNGSGCGTLRACRLARLALCPPCAAPLRSVWHSLFATPLARLACCCLPAWHNGSWSCPTSWAPEALHAPHLAAPAACSPCRRRHGRAAARGQRNRHPSGLRHVRVHVAADAVEHVHYRSVRVGS